MRISELRAIAEDSRRREAALLLAPLEKALRLAEAAGDYRAVIRIVALQAQLTGLTGRQDALTGLDMVERPGAPGPLERVSAAFAALSRPHRRETPATPAPVGEIRDYLPDRRPDPLDRLSREDSPPHPQLTCPPFAMPLAPVFTPDFATDCATDFASGRN